MDLRNLRKLPYIVILLRYGVDDKEFRMLNLTKIANELGVTAQNLSKIMNILERDGLIEKNFRGQLMIKLTPKASEIMALLIDCVRDYLDKVLTFKLAGSVISGIGEGCYYMSLEGYVKQFTEKLHFKPYPGTLNVKLKRESLKYRLYLDLLPGILIKGFTDKGRTYGGVKCFKASVNNIPCGVLIIERTHHGPEIIELISPFKLRDILGLRDGDDIEIIVNI